MKNLKQKKNYITRFEWKILVLPGVDDHPIYYIKQTNHHHHYQHPKHTNIDTPVIFQNIWDSLSSSSSLFVTEIEKTKNSNISNNNNKKLNQTNKVFYKEQIKKILMFFLFRWVCVYQKHTQKFKNEFNFIAKSFLFSRADACLFFCFFWLFKWQKHSNNQRKLQKKNKSHLYTHGERIRSI